MHFLIKFQTLVLVFLPFVQERNLTTCLLQRLKQNNMSYDDADLVNRLAVRMELSEKKVACWKKK